jgi:hypothetical protein
MIGIARITQEFALIAFDSDIRRSGDTPDLFVAVIGDLLNTLLAKSFHRQAGFQQIFTLKQ